jgi:hypothetical protein
MGMIGAAEIKSEVKKLLKAKFPKTIVSRVDVEEASDADGQPSMNVLIVFKTRPPKHDMRYGKRGLVDELRTWLSKQADDRFPYFSFLTEKDEKELSSHVNHA